MKNSLKLICQLSSLITACVVLNSCFSLNENLALDTGAPDSFKEGDDEGQAPKEEWWTLFHSPQLNQLMGRIEDENFQLQAGLARIDRACAVLGSSRSDLIPGVQGSYSVKQIRTSKNDLGGRFFLNQYQQYRAALASSWEIDLWGRVRSAVCGAQMDVRQVERLTADLRLSLQSQLAQSYFSLRFLDEEKRVLLAAVKTREDNLELARTRLKGEVGNELDVARAESELESTRADLAALEAPRARLEHAIAVLVGDAPANFQIKTAPMDGCLPKVRAGIPMCVLENRPDVAAAIAKLESANARIGVAKAEFFPRLDLVGNAGRSSIDSSAFFDWSSRTYNVGPEVTLPIFQGGRLKANLKGARATQAEALADYQQTVLDALREVEDALSDLRSLKTEHKAQILAVKATDSAFEISQKRQLEGLVDAIEVVDALREKLNTKRRAVNICGSQYEATVRLIQALGGGW